MRRVGEIRPDVRADLGDDRRGRQRPDTRDGDQEVTGGTKGQHHRLDLRVQLRDHAVKVIEMVQVQAAQHRVVLPEPALQRHRQVRDLAPHPAPGQVRQDRAAPLPVDQGLDHRPPQLRRDTGRDRIDLDPGVLQHVPQPGDLADPLLGDLRPVADHVPRRLDVRRGDEAARQQPALQQLRQPFRVRQGLAPRHVLHVPGVADQDLPEVPVLDQRMVDGHRVDPGRFHRHMGDALRDQPPRRLGQYPVERLVRPLHRDPPRRPVTRLPDRDRDHVLADVDPCAPLVKNLHAASSGHHQ